jgi:hypothetical protein
MAKRAGPPHRKAKKTLDPNRAHFPKNKSNVATWQAHGNRNPPHTSSGDRVDAAHVLSDLGVRELFGQSVLVARTNQSLRPQIVLRLGELAGSLLGPANDTAQRKIVDEGLQATSQLMSAEVQHLPKTQPMISVLTREAMNNLRPGIGHENSSIQEHFDPNIDVSGSLTPRSRKIAENTHSLASLLGLPKTSAYLTTRSGMYVGDLLAGPLPSFSDSSGYLQ